MRLRLQRNHTPPCSGIGTSIIPHLYSAPIGASTVCDTVSPSHVNLSGSNPTSFRVHSNLIYKRPQVAVHIAQTTANVLWANRTPGSSIFTFAQPHLNDPDSHTSYAQPRTNLTPTYLMAWSSSF